MITITTARRPRPGAHLPIVPALPAGAAPAAMYAAVQAAAAAAPAAVPAGGEKIAAPMPGTILAVNVAVGDTVEKGTVLMVLEAMKMENEIMAPCSGKVTFVGVTKGQSVNTGAPLCTIE